VVPTILALIALQFDMIQYVAGYQDSRRLLQRMRRNDVDIAMYDESSILYRIRVASYWLKLCSSIIAALWLIVVVGHRALQLM